MITGLVACGEKMPTNSDPSLTALTSVSASPEDGSNGKDGKSGKAGEKGSSCSVKDNEDGTAKIVCEDGTEAAIASKDGKDGKDGLDGKDGAAGEKGKDGIDAKDGKDGVDGVAGEKGAKGDQGDQGVAGVKGDKGDIGDQGSQGPVGDVLMGLPVVEDGNGLELGKLIYMDSISGAWAILMDGGLRAKIDNNGYPETLKTYFSGAGCTGTRRAVVPNGFFGNFQKDNFKADGTYWKISSNNLGSFVYQSREDGDGICDVASGTITSSTYSIATGVHMGFTIPFGAWPRIKEVE